jgi:hypothetical protein
LISEVIVWVLLSSRLRTWLMLAVAVPLLRAVLRRASSSAAQRDPSSRAARGLRSLETGLGDAAGELTAPRHPDPTGPDLPLRSPCRVSARAPMCPGSCALTGFLTDDAPLVTDGSHIVAPTIGFT